MSNKKPLPTLEVREITLPVLVDSDKDLWLFEVDKTLREQGFEEGTLFVKRRENNKEDVTRYIVNQGYYRETPLQEALSKHRMAVKETPSMFDERQKTRELFVELDAKIRKELA